MGGKTHTSAGLTMMVSQHLSVITKQNKDNVLVHVWLNINIFQPLKVVGRGSETKLGHNVYENIYYLTFSLPYMTEISVVIRQWT